MSSILFNMDITIAIYLSPSAKHSAEGQARVRRAYTQIATICFLKKFFCKQMAVAHSIFTLDGGFQLFYAAFDMPVTGVALKVALGCKKIVFWPFQKNNQQTVTCITLGCFGILGK